MNTILSRTFPRSRHRQLVKRLLPALALVATLLPGQAAQADIPALSFLAGLLNQPVFPQSDAYTTNDDIVVTADDGVPLAANVFIPTAGTGPYPAVVFINSWALNEYEYLTEAARFAKQGYVVLSYSTRGFGQSGGLIDTAGPKDIADFKRMIDWLVANTPTDPSRIGAAGISYGSGISLIGAAQDSRIRAVAALSTWGSLEQALYGQQTPRLIWGELLTLSSNLLGRPDPIIQQHFNDLLQHQNVPEIMAWAAPRSPISWVNQLNANGTAVYFAKNWGDDLFQPNSILDLYEQLQVPKHIDLQSGTHASVEIFGMIGSGDTHVWNNVHRWFDTYLKGLETPITSMPPVQMKVKLQNDYQGYSDFPVPEAQAHQWYLHPRGLLNPGGLEDSPWQGWFSVSNRIDSLADTLASTGIPLVSQVFEQVNVPPTASMPLIAPGQGIWFETDRLNQTLAIRGIPTLQLQVEPQYNTAQLVAYLYDMDIFGMGSLITHAPITLPSVEKGKPLTLNMELVATAYDVPAGHRLVLAIDTQDLFYKEPTWVPYAIDFKFSNSKQSILKVPAL